MQSYFKEAGLDTRMRDFRIFDAWREALGTELCKRARAIQFRSGTLVVETESAAHRSELASFTGEQYRQRANQILGGERIQKITYKLKH